MIKYIKIPLFLLLALFLFIPSPGAQAAQGDLIHQEVIASYFDVWKGNNWQDTDNDGIADKPGQRKQPKFTYTAPDEILEKYIITDVKIKEPVTKSLYESRENPADGSEGEMPWYDFNIWYNYYLADIHKADAKLINADQGRAEVTWDIILKTPVEINAVDLVNEKNRDYLGLPASLFTDLNEGYRWYMPGIIEWYGIPKEGGPDLYVGSIDPGTDTVKPGEPYRRSGLWFNGRDEPVKGRLELTHNGIP